MHWSYSQRIVAIHSRKNSEADGVLKRFRRRFAEEKISKFMEQIKNIFYIKFLIFYLSSGLGAVALTFLVYYVQVYPLLSNLESFGFSFDFIREASSLNIISDRMFKGEILASKLEPVMSSYGYSMNQLNGESFRMLFDLNVKSNGSMVGASGAIMGVLVAFGLLNPNAELMMLFLPIPIKAKYFIPGIIALDLFSAFTGVSIFSPNNTAYIAHIGGAVTGFLLMYFWKKNQFDKYRWN